MYIFFNLQAFLEWKNARREEVSEYQKQIGDQYLANVEKELERWQNARNARKVNNDQNLQETMDKELDTHRLEHGPKKRKIPDGNNNEDDDDVEDINVGEDDMMDDELDDDSGRRIDETTKSEAGNAIADPAADADNAEGKWSRTRSQFSLVMSYLFCSLYLAILSLRIWTFSLSIFCINLELYIHLFSLYC